MVFKCLTKGHKTEITQVINDNDILDNNIAGEYIDNNYDA